MRKISLLSIQLIYIAEKDRWSEPRAISPGVEIFPDISEPQVNHFEYKDQ